MSRLGSTLVLLAIWAVSWLTNLGLIEKGRMIEIDAIYVSLFGFAFILWLVLWQRGGSPWLTFVVPWIFLGVGMLAKGPAHLIFFYVLICAVLWRNHRLGDLAQPAHVVGVLCTAGIFAALLLPFLHKLLESPLEAW